MAIALDAISSTNSSASSFSDPVILAHTCTGSNLVLLVGVTYQDSNHGNYGSNNVTYDGEAMVLIRSDEAVGNVYTELWIKVGPSTGANNIIVTPNSAAAPGEIAVGGISLTGAKQSGQPEANNGATGSSNTPSVSVTTIDINSWVVDVLANEAGNPTAGAGQTRRWYKADQSFENGSGSTEGPVTPAGATTMSWSIPSGAPWALSAASIAPVTASAAPTVTTDASATGVSADSAVVGGNVTSDGNETITERGVAYSLSANPTTADNTETNPGTTGAFTVTLLGLSASTTYHARAYAINSVGTSYGADIDFTTDSAPIVTYTDVVKLKGGVDQIKPITTVEPAVTQNSIPTGQIERFYPVTVSTGQAMGLLIAITYTAGFTVNSSKSI